MSRRDQVFQAFNSVQDHVFEYIDSHNSSTTIPQAGASIRHRPDTAADLPTYGRRQTFQDPVPDEILHAPPGQAQTLADQLPLSRMARGDARDARRAAAVLRQEQLKTGQLKVRHSFASSNGRIILDIQSTPQKTLTYMGGTAERGRGAMKGKVIIHAQEGDRVSAIRLKIKAVVRVHVPNGPPPTRVSATAGPLSLDLIGPDQVATSEKEVLLLQLESKLYSTSSTSFPSGSTSNDPSLLKKGTHEYPFSIDLPSQVGNKGSPLPPSFVLSPLNKGTQALANGRGMFKLPSLSNDWATIKWYAKLTVERPGLFRANERIFAPFVYLPPPPKLNGIEDQLNRRLRLAFEVDNVLRRFQATNYSGSISMENFIEPVSKWSEVRLDYGIGSKRAKKIAPTLASDKSSEDGPGLFSRLLFGSQVDGPSAPLKEVFTLSIPKNPNHFPLRSGIPFVIHRQIEWKGQRPLMTEMLSRIPQVVLFQRVNVFGKARGEIAGSTLRLMTSSRQSPDARPSASWNYEPKGSGKSQMNRRGESWLGIVDLPPNCTPSFSTPLVTLNYTLSIRVGAGQSAEELYSEPVILCCPPSRPVPAAVATVRPTSNRRSSHSSRQPTVSTSSPIKSKEKSDSKKITQASSVSRPGATEAGDSSSRRTSASSGHDTHAPSRLTSSNSTNTSNAVGSSSRSRPTAQTSVPAVIDEKRVLRENYSNHTSHPVASEQSRPHQPQPPPPSSSSAAAAPIVPTRTVHQSAASSRAPSVAGTNEDDDSDLGEDPSQWQFHEDELTDLPPSYFEATIATDRDD
ncbi:hypothetical protein CBS101457_004722 [Exobasidium rhododendri]|nr:hypothetical protein CBS101457_004722 [Exobasidium rhododendri]